MPMIRAGIFYKGKESTLLRALFTLHIIYHSISY